MRPIIRRTFCQGCATLAALHPLALKAQAPEQRVVASFSILANMAQELAPAGVQVIPLVGPDSDAHVYEPSPADGRRLAQADLVLINGLGFEGWIERMVKVSGYRGPVAVASRGIQPRSGGHHDVDPHAWQDLALARRYAANISAALTQRWPGQRDEIARRNADYVARIDQLDARVRQWLGAVPRAQRRVITSHDAFGYLGAAYGVDFLAPQGWTTHSEPSAAAVARLIRQIKKERVRAIFVESISDPRLVERIAREGGARIGGTLYSDALSKPDGPAATYLQLFEHNARSLAAALQV
ncbi:MAG: zinc ABC transporter substrate-binding protein [Burkholderiaceae bacterium]|jgi:zinc/manganese transport system substrate-binding protein|nr:zinc ABC transporter substrate-binding protein [Aquabacterium sp.]NUP84981.1 zinc ABC transporter substrate-binding protein [Burkholderiaceae bacterium]